MTKNKQRTWLVLLTVILSFVGILVANPSQVSAASKITSGRHIIQGVSKDKPAILPGNFKGSGGRPPVLIPKGDNVYMDPKYTFVPQVTAATKVTTSGSSHSWNYNTTWLGSLGPNFDIKGQPGNTKYYSIPANSNSQKGAWIRYSNIGVVDGQNVDLKITVMDWTNYFTNTGFISFRLDDIGVSTKGQESVDLKWEFLKSGTNNKINVSGYFTFGDIDLSQGIRFSKATTNAIDAVILDEALLASNKHSRLNHSISNGKYYVFDDVTASELANQRDYDSPDDSGDPSYKFSMLYSNQSELRFEWVAGFGNRADTRMNNNRHFNYYGNTIGYNAAMGSYMFYVLDKPIPTRIPDIEKEPVKSTINTADGNLQHVLTHSVPQEAPGYRYTEYAIQDVTQPGLMNPKITKIVNQNGTDVSNWFVRSNSKDMAAAVARPTTLSNPNFYGNTYYVYVTSEIDYDYVNSLSAEEFTFENSGMVINNSHVVETDGEKPNPVSKVDMPIEHINQDNNVLLSSKELSLLAGSEYSESATHHGDGYGTDGVLHLNRTLVNGSNKGALNPATGEVGENGTTIKFYYRSPFKISHTHLDDDRNSVIQQDRHIDQKWKGSSYSYTANLRSENSTFRDNGRDYPYYPIDSPQTGTINFQNGNTDYNYNVNFRHTKPNVDVGIERVRIKTDHKSNGLPIRIDFDMLSIDEAFWGGEDRWENTDLRVQIIDKSNSNKVIYNKLHTAKSLRNDPLLWTIPSTGLQTDQTRTYEVKVLSPDKTKLFVRPEAASIQTIGYTASEETVSVKDTNLRWGREVSGEWVAMTEKYIGQATVKEYMEGFNTVVDYMIEMPTGYPHGNVNTIETWTEIDDVNDIPKVNGDIFADPEVSDGNYAVAGDGRNIVKVKEEESLDSDAKKISTEFELAQTYVTEGGTGEVIVSNTQPEGSVDGGNQMYIPVWLDDLGTYNYTFETIEPVGRNHINIVIERSVDVESYMFAHSDSDTIDKDALLLQPIFDNWFANIANRDPFESRRDYMWQADDFEYDGNAVVGFSSKGIQNYQSIPEGTARLEIPATNPSTGATITEIRGTDVNTKGSFFKYKFIGEFVAPTVEKIGDYAFYNSEFSGQFSAPKLKSVGRYAFTDSLFSGTMNAPQLDTVGDYGFYHSTFDGEMNISNIGEDAFYHSDF